MTMQFANNPNNRIAYYDRAGDDCKPSLEDGLGSGSTASLTSLSCRVKGPSGSVDPEPTSPSRVVVTLVSGQCAGQTDLVRRMAARGALVYHVERDAYVYTTRLEMTQCPTTSKTASPTTTSETPTP